MSVEQRILPNSYQTNNTSLTSDYLHPSESPFDCPVQWRSPSQIATSTSPFKSQESFTKELSDKGQSIYESYNAFNEAERMQKLSNLSQEQQAYYISENVISYLEEFVGQIRLKKLSGVLKADGSLEMLGTNVTDMYNHSAQLAGRGSREDKEKTGLDLITQGMQSGLNRAVWISPPKLADYGFAFTFITDDFEPKLQGRPFREILLRYNEPRGSVETSRAVHASLGERLGINTPDRSEFQHEGDFLAHPLVYNHNGFEDLEALYEYLDISPEDVKRSEEFRLQVQPVIQQYLNRYIDIIQQMSSDDLIMGDPQLKQLEQDANELLGAMFNAARIIQRKTNTIQYSAEILEKDEQQLQMMQVVSDPQAFIYAARNMSQYESLTIQGGSNCPVTKQAGSAESTFLSYLESGLSVSTAMEKLALESDHYENYKCPHCKKELSGEYKHDQTKWRTECDHCHKTINCKDDKNQKDLKNNVKLNI